MKYTALIISKFVPQEHNVLHLKSEKQFIHPVLSD